MALWDRIRQEFAQSLPEKVDQSFPKPIVACPDSKSKKAGATIELCGIEVSDPMKVSMDAPTFLAEYVNKLFHTPLDVELAKAEGSSDWICIIRLDCIEYANVRSLGKKAALTLASTKVLDELYVESIIMS